ncbi:hypothetical protein ANN_17634, partial [Periplaneta americana]
WQTAKKTRGEDTFHKPPTKIQNLLRPVKDDLVLRTPGVYKIPCECEKCYIGQTGHTIMERCKEHQHSIRLYYLDKPAVAQHSLETGHKINFGATTILDKTSGYWDVVIKEAIEIQLDGNNFNRDGVYSCVQHGNLPSTHLDHQHTADSRDQQLAPDWLPLPPTRMHLANIKTLPTTYEANCTAWMTSSIFASIMHALDAKMGPQQRKILLLLVFHVKVAVWCQRLQLKNMKLSNECVSPMRYVTYAWLNVTPATVSNCFLKTGFYFEEEQVDVEEESNNWSMVAESSSFEEYVNIDTVVITSVVSTVDDIVFNHQGGGDDGKEKETEPVTVQTSQEAMDAITILRQYIASACGEEEAYNALYAVERLVEQIQMQTKISQFFQMVLIILEQMLKNNNTPQEHIEEIIHITDTITKQNHFTYNNRYYTTQTGGLLMVSSISSILAEIFIHNIKQTYKLTKTTTNMQTAYIGTDM